MAGKGSGRRPTDKRHALPCPPHAMPDARGLCFRCGAQVGDYNRWPVPAPWVPVPPPETTTGEREIL